MPRSSSFEEQPSTSKADDGKASKGQRRNKKLGKVGRSFSTPAKLAEVDQDIDVLSPKPNGTTMDDASSVDSRENKTTIRWMWKKAFKSLKKDRDKEKDRARDEPARGEKVNVPEREEKRATYSRMNSRQSSLKKGGLLKRKDSKEQQPTNVAEEEPETTDKACGGSADPIFATLKYAASIKKDDHDVSDSEDY